MVSNWSDPTVTPAEFSSKWSKVSLSERAAYQQHFLPFCLLPFLCVRTRAAAFASETEKVTRVQSSLRSFL